MTTHLVQVGLSLHTGDMDALIEPCTEGGDYGVRAKAAPPRRRWTRQQWEEFGVEMAEYKRSMDWHRIANLAIFAHDFRQRRYGILNPVPRLPQ